MILVMSNVTNFCRSGSQFYVVSFSRRQCEQNKQNVSLHPGFTELKTQCRHMHVQGPAEIPEDLVTQL